MTDHRAAPDALSLGGPWAGYNSLEEAIEGLRAGRFRISAQFNVSGRGLVLEGTIIHGRIRPTMILLASLERHPHVLVSFPISAVEEVRHANGLEATALVLGDIPSATLDQSPNFSLGTSCDILLRSPAV